MKRSWSHLWQVAAGSLLTAAVVVVALVLFAGAMSGKAQSQFSREVTPVPWSYKYEVVSIKPTGSGSALEDSGFGYDESPDGVSIRLATLMTLMVLAYPEGGIRPAQNFGAPAWAWSDRFAIEAKMNPSVMEELKKLSPSQQRFARAKMLQALLADYFKLAVHVETRDLPAYFLVVAKNGPKLKQAIRGETYPKGPIPQSPWMPGTVVMAPPDPPVAAGTRKFVGLGAPMATLVIMLSGPARRIVVDKTGLTGNYDFELQFTGTDEVSSAESESRWPPLFTAIQQQLGLKLDPGKAPSPVLVIDHVEKPMRN
jgi:uncharacterized protein (TIGR03435 family)